MLSEHEKNLIAAAVGGELSAEEERACSALLARSPAAIELHAAMVNDRERLAALPRRPAPQDLATAIFAAIQRDCPTVPAKSSRYSKRSKWIPAAMAASFFIAVSSGTYWFVAGSQSPRMVNKQLQQLPKDNLVLVPQANPNQVAVLPGSPAVELPIAPSAPEAPTIPSTSVTANQTPDATKPKEPPLDPNRILAAPVGNDVKAFDRVELKLPLLIPFTDLATEESQAALQANLARDPATRVDLFAKDTAKAAEALVAAGKKLNLNIQIETVASERMKRKMPSAWWIYTEALTPQEIAKWLGETAAVEAALTSPSEKTFGNLHAVAAGNLEQKDSLSLAGVDLGIGKKTPPTSNAHISSKTIDQVTGSLQKAETPKPGILLTYLPPLVRVHPLLSKDIKQYHELRKDRKPGTVPLVIVVRPSA